MISSYLQQRLEHKSILLMTHLIVGYPSLEANWRMLEIMQEHDVDLVELQWPFSEPMADGPLFAKANLEALKNGIRRHDYFRFMKKASETFKFPLLMMGYYNPVYKMGHEAFCKALHDAGGKGFIIPDLPLEEFGDLNEHSTHHDLSPIMLITPTNTPERIQQLASHGKGFVYCVARKGVTGSDTTLDHGVEHFMQQCHAASEVPLALGFGLSTAEDIQQIQNTAEIAIVGSALLKTWESGGEEAYSAHLKTLASVGAT